MLNSQPLDRDYLIDSLDEVDAVVDELSFNVQDQHWLCTAPLAAMSITTCRISTTVPA